MHSVYGSVAAVTTSLLIALAAASGSAVADAIKPADVKVQDGEISKSLSGKDGDPAAGKEAFTARKLGNCLACHENADAKKELFHGEVGPSLNGVADRYSPAQLRAIVANPKAVFGDQTIMPSFYRESGYNRILEKFEGQTILTAQQVEDVVAYLTTLKE